MRPRRLELPCLSALAPQARNLSPQGVSRCFKMVFARTRQEFGGVPQYITTFQNVSTAICGKSVPFRVPRYTGYLRERCPLLCPPRWGFSGAECRRFRALAGGASAEENQKIIRRQPSAHIPVSHFPPGHGRGFCPWGREKPPPPC